MTTNTRKRIIALTTTALFAAGGLTAGALPAHADMDMEKDGGERTKPHKTVRHIPMGPFDSVEACEEAKDPDDGLAKPATLDPDWDDVSACYQHGSKIEAYYFDAIYEGWSTDAKPAGGYKHRRPPV